MTVNVSKPAFNIREKLSELDRPVGNHGTQLMQSADAAESFDLVRAGRKNRIINGDFRISQRNAGSSTTFNGYTIDRWYCTSPGAQGATRQRVTDAPPGFGYSEKVTQPNSVYQNQTTAKTCDMMQIIEGDNVADLNFGTSYAKDVTISFWVKASQAGEWSIALCNNQQNHQNISPKANRTWIDSYTVYVANTWEYKSVTIPGDTGGSWVRTGNLGGMSLIFDLGSGTDYIGTTQSWITGHDWTKSGAERLGNVANATWQITGVQLEEGTVATPYEYRNYVEELALCQRYYYRHCNSEYENIGTGFIYYSGTGYVSCYFPVTMRTTPSLVHTAGSSGAYTYQVMVSNQALYYHTLGTDTNKDNPNSAVVSVGGPSIASRAGQGFALSAHTSTNVAFSAEV